MSQDNKFKEAYLDFRKKNFKRPKSIEELKKLFDEAKKEGAEGWQKYFEVWIAIEEQRYPEALKALKMAIPLMPDIPFPHVSMIFIKNCLGKIDEALLECRSLVAKLRKSKNPADKEALAEAVANMGAVYHCKRDKKLCTACFEEVEEWHKNGNIPVLENTASIVKGNLALLKWNSEPKTALQLVDEALDIDPQLISALVLRARILRRLCSDDPSRKEEAEQATKKVAEVIGKEEDPDILVYLDAVLGEFSLDAIRDYFIKIEEDQKRLDEFLADTPSFNPSSSFLLVLREWNSYTPIIPEEYDPGRGGGYFIWHQDQGIVIDPGYDFIRNFGEAGGRIRDIHYILVTHAHNDHTADFESLLVLLNKYNNLHKEEPKKVKLYLSQGAFSKFSGLIPLRGSSYVDEVTVLNRGRQEEPQTIKLCKGLTLTVLPAYHDDVITQHEAVGLGFRLENNGWKQILVLTSDTGLFPKRYDEKGNPIPFPKYQDVYQVEIDEKKAIYSHYPKDLFCPDLLIAHIGSIKMYELSHEPLSEERPRFYPDHLGILGTVKLIDKLDPKMVVVSEMGEELKNLRGDSVNKIKRALENTRHAAGKGSAPSPFIIPGDRNIVYYFDKGSPLCHTTYQPEPVDNLTFSEFEELGVCIYKRGTDGGICYRAIKSYRDLLKKRKLLHHYQY